MNGSGDDIVARLSSINMVIRVHWRLATHFTPQNFNGTIGNDLVGIHIGGGAGPCLKNIHRKLFIQLALCRLGSCLDDGSGHLLGEKAQFEIHPSRSPFYQTHSANEFPRKPETTNGEILHRSLGLGPIIGYCRNLYLTHGITFNSIVLFFHFKILQEILSSFIYI